MKGLSIRAPANWSMAFNIVITLFSFLKEIKCLKNQILGKIKLPGFPMLSSHYAEVDMFKNRL